MSKHVQVGDILTTEEAIQVLNMFEEMNDGLGDVITFVRRVADEVITPALPRINEKTGQENDPRYLAYALLAVCTQHVQERASNE